jgi:FkbM family methyltransferase
MIRHLFAPQRRLGRLVRLPLRLLPRRLPLPVLSGVNRGCRWTVGAGIHGCWLGTYEREKLRLVSGFVRPGMTVFDVGAHAGYYSLAFARLVGPEGMVRCFEPNSVNLANLRRHLALNRLQNVEVVAAAVSDHTGTARFTVGEAADVRDIHYLGAISDKGDEVACVRLDDYEDPAVIKMDIEGGEGPALAGATRILARQQTHLFISLHGVSDQQCMDELIKHGYDIHHITHNEIHARPRQPA